MRLTDIIFRAYSNLKRSKRRSRKTIISISIGICSMLVLVALCTGAQNASNRFLSETYKLLRIEVSGVKIQGANTILPTMQGSAYRNLNEDDINFLRNQFNNNIKLSFTKSLITDFNIGELDDYTFKTNTVGIDYDALSKLSAKYYEGGNIKDLMGAIVSKSFISKALYTKDWENGNNYNMQTIDVLGKVIEFKVIAVNINNDKRESREIKVPVRIDGILEDDNQYFGDTGAIFDEKEPDSVFSKSVIYIPIERIQAIQAQLGENHLITQRSVTLNVKDISSMDNVLTELKNKNYAVSTEYDYYNLIRYLTFTLKLVFGTLGILILLTAAIGIINTMIMSVLERKKDIGIFKAIGVKIKYIKGIYITEAAFLGLFGGTIGGCASLILIKIINLIANNLGINNVNESVKIAMLPLHVMFAGILSSLLLSVLASIPCLRYVSRMEITNALK